MNRYNFRISNLDEFNDKKYQNPSVYMEYINNCIDETLSHESEQQRKYTVMSEVLLFIITFIQIAPILYNALIGNYKDLVFWPIIIMAIIVIILQQIDANIINPKIIGDSLKISQLVVIFAVTIGGAYFGVLGMFLAVPVFTVIKLIIEDYIEEQEKRKLKTSIDNNGDVSL